MLDRENQYKNHLAYIIGVAIGDGNLSNPNGRATRLRITCDNKYPYIIKKIQLSIKTILPKNKVSIIRRKKTYCDISCYSNKWENWLGWKSDKGPKYNQNIKIPAWIKESQAYSIQCLQGLLETDGSIYRDRKYKMVNFVTIIKSLADDVVEMINNIGFTAKTYKLKYGLKNKYTIRISKNTDEFLKITKLVKK